jgi:hypothetical protein
MALLPFPLTLIAKPPSSQAHLALVSVQALSPKLGGHVCMQAFAAVGFCPVLTHHGASNPLQSACRSPPAILSKAPAAARQHFQNGMVGECDAAGPGVRLLLAAPGPGELL